VKLVARSRQNARGPRCPYCHDDVGPLTQRLACDACSAWHHTECWTEGDGCSVCGGGASGLAPTTAGKSEETPAPLQVGAWEHLRWLLLSFEGRISPRTFLRATALLILIYTVASLPALAILGEPGFALTWLPAAWVSLALNSYGPPPTN
jgi:hypothetical protein